MNINFQLIVRRYIFLLISIPLAQEPVSITFMIDTNRYLLQTEIEFVIYSIEGSCVLFSKSQ